MLWIALALAALVSLAALVYVVWPLVQPKSAPVLVQDDRLVDLIARKDTLLQAIKELEFDYRVGKLDEADYQRFDQQLRRQAIGLLQQIEKVAPESASLDDRLEQEIARLRKTSDGERIRAKPSPLPSPAPVADGATPGAARTRYCTNCGEPLSPAHKFCANCGAPIDAPVAAERPS
jgi:hypothetical protein